QCWCGASDVDYDRHGSGTCDDDCEGDSSVKCGGYYAFTLYEQRPTPTTPAPTPAPTMYQESLGCFKDEADDRVLTNMLSSPDMTPTVCAAHCSSYAYYATQYGNQCWCGASDVDYDRHGSGTCDDDCEGDSSVKCGGYYAFTLYEQRPTPTTPAPTPAPTMYQESLGCFKDKSTDRVLT
ncbi:unnamed protein product, partial [Sphacelaria rigidula]